MTFTGLRTRRYTYVEYATGEKELYDLRKDPYQLRNAIRVPSYDAIQKHLAHELSTVHDCAGSVCRMGTRTPY
jgi:hypothetical protein